MATPRAEGIPGNPITRPVDSAFPLTQKGNRLSGVRHGAADLIAALPARVHYAIVGGKHGQQYSAECALVLPSQFEDQAAAETQNHRPRTIRLNACYKTDLLNRAADIRRIERK